MHETFRTLLTDPAHWEFELFLMLLFDGVVGCVLFPFVRKHWQHHVDRDAREQNKTRWRVVGIAPMAERLGLGAPANSPKWPRSGRFYEPVKGKPCPRCGIGVDDDRDGHCGVCVRLLDTEIGAMKEQELKYPTPKPALGTCHGGGALGKIPHVFGDDCVNWLPVSTKTRKNHG